MIIIKIEKNDEEQRLDRFLKKYYPKAALGYIYKIIRKDLKINGKRGKIDTLLREGDQLNIYISKEESDSLRRKEKSYKSKKQFIVAYEDKNMVIVGKPFGLLTHGDSKEKKNTLANQVCGYLMEKGDYNPRVEQTFVPAPINRLDRNTTGLVIFGKNAKAVKELNIAIQNKDQVVKTYETIVIGKLDQPTSIRGTMEKDESRNVVKALEEGSEGKYMETHVTPLKVGEYYSHVRVQLVTGRSHQIRVQLATIGHPIIGDRKYGNPKGNKRLQDKFSLTTQLLHARSLEFTDGVFKGISAHCPLPENFIKIEEALFKYF